MSKLSAEPAISVSRADWGSFRLDMPITEQWAYFDHASVAPISGPARQAIQRYSNEAAEQGTTIWMRWDRQIERVRQLAAELVGADSHEIALVPNTTSGISLVAEGFPWREGDNLVTLANEFPSNQYPWLNLATRGVETRRVPVEGGRVDLNRVAEACDEKTRLVALSWIGFASGWRIDPAEAADMAHRQGALFLLDAIQGLGVFPLDVRAAGIDFLAADGHKWMLGPEGAGLLFVRREHLDLLRPLNVGWNSVAHRQDFDRIELDIRNEAVRYEGGSQNMVGMMALGASLELLRDAGLGPKDDTLARRVIDLTDQACDRLQEIGAVVVSHREGKHRSGIVSFTLPGVDPKAMRAACNKEGVVLSCRAGRLRISPHVYNNHDDLDRLISTLSKQQLS